MTTNTAPRPPILMRAEECVGIKRAADHAGQSDRTIRRWISAYGIGRRPLGARSYSVSLPALEMVLHGDQVALDLLRDGRRAEPAVRRYFEHLGLPE